MQERKFQVCPSDITMLIADVKFRFLIKGATKL